MRVSDGRSSVKNSLSNIQQRLCELHKLSKVRRLLLLGKFLILK